jgi:hypothetical protein
VIAFRNESDDNNSDDPSSCSDEFASSEEPKLPDYSQPASPGDPPRSGPAMVDGTLVSEYIPAIRAPGSVRDGMHASFSAFDGPNSETNADETLAFDVTYVLAQLRSPFLYLNGMAGEYAPKLSRSGHGVFFHIPATDEDIKGLLVTQEAMMDERFGGNSNRKRAFEIQANSLNNSGEYHVFLFTNNAYFTHLNDLQLHIYIVHRIQSRLHRVWEEV